MYKLGTTEHRLLIQKIIIAITHISNSSLIRNLEPGNTLINTNTLSKHLPTELKNSLTTIIVWNIIGTEDSQLTQSHLIDLNLRNCMLIFKVISKWCTPKTTTIDQSLRENISIDLWNSKKKVIPSLHLIKDQLISYGTLENHQVFERLRAAKAQYVVRWTEAKLVNSIEPLPILSSASQLYSKLYLLQTAYRTKFYSRKCTLNQKIWITKLVRSLTITDKSHSWEKIMKSEHRRKDLKKEEVNHKSS